MNQKQTIRIIKSGQREVPAGTAKTAAPASPKLRETTREIAGNVANWVKDFQQRRRPDPRRSFASLFVEPAV
jgi:hypothetical protein